MRLLGLKESTASAAFLAIALISFFHLEGFWISVATFFFLCLGISSAVHSAEVLARRVGPSVGTLILAIAVTVIEVPGTADLCLGNVLDCIWGFDFCAD